MLERVQNLLLAGCVLSWAVLGLVHADPASRWTPVRVAVGVLHLGVSAALACRRPARWEAGVAAVVACLPSLASGGVALALAPDPSHWPPAASTLFVAGTALTLAGLVSLGRNFSVLPAVRRIARGGVFRWIRHPVYAGEMLMITAAAWARGSWPAALVCGGALVAVVVRILVEERVLASSTAFRHYARQVRWRLIPLVW